MRIVSRFWLSLFCAVLLAMPLLMAVAEARPNGAVP